MRFLGKVGYGVTTEVVLGEGIYEESITEVAYRGDVLRNNARNEHGDRVISDLVMSNSISIIADAYALNHAHTIKYVEWQGARWVVNSIEVKPPRIVLTLGGVYNGPTP